MLVNDLTVPLNIARDCMPLTLRWVPHGKFTMGNTDGDHEEPMGEFEVILSKGFWLGVYPVTQCQWESVMGTNPSKFKGSNKPIESISWQDTIDFCNRLDDEVIAIPNGYAFSLPTEAQWEYACKSGAESKYQVGDKIEDLSKVAWHRANIVVPGTQDVGQKEPNNWGLYDMLGNVMEWCFDSPLDYPAGTTQNDYVGGTAQGFRNLRGGSAFTSPDSDILTCSGRMYTGTDPNPFFGFRLCLRNTESDQQ